MPRQAAAEAAQRNSDLSSFEKLPTELLVEIAKHLQDDANFPHIGPPLKMPENAFLGLESTLETLVWVGYETNYSNMARAISSMKVLKHIKTNNLR
ncbi:hypothetical protein K4K57_003462 [Colletotrichum sp. SAR 10_99]|nr:hypothetical protein K4K57_003462 [Colletotrichum sp. SAR 10_99]